MTFAQARGPRDLGVREVDAHHVTGVADARAGTERVGPGAGAEVEHTIAGLEHREVEVVADAGERLHGLRGDRVEHRLGIAEPERESAAGLEVTPRERIARDAAVHLLNLLLQHGAIDEGRGVRSR